MTIQKNCYGHYTACSSSSINLEIERKNTKLVKLFEKALKVRRKAAGLSQEEFVHWLDLSVNYISLMETENRQTTLTVLVAVASELGLSIWEFAAEFELT